MRTILAVDAGNSKTDIALVTEDGRVLATGRGPGFEPQKVGVAAAVDAIDEALHQALGAARPCVDHVAAFVAGADLPTEEAMLVDEITARGYASTLGGVLVGNDTFALLRAGASSPHAVAVVCGAGINAVGVSPTGETFRFLSLGEITGDWGGGIGLGLQVIWHAIRAEDGRGPTTTLAEMVRACFGTGTVTEACIELHLGHRDIQEVNLLVPLLMAQARAGDPVAYSLIDRMADEVVVMAVVVMRRLGMLDTATELVLGGGLLTARDPLLGSLIDEKLAKQAPHAQPVVADLPPLVGAALLGLDRIGAGEPAKRLLRSHFSTP